MEKTATLGSRLRQLMTEREMNYEQFGALLNMRPQTLNRYVLGQREPKAAAAAAIALTLDVDPLWLQGYNVPREPRRAPSPPRAPGEAVIPILGVIRAGVPILARQNVEGYASADVSDPENYFYLRVAGDSMQGAGIHDGDLVLIRRQDFAQSGQIVACMVDEEAATLKRFRRQGDMVILQPENPAYEPRIISMGDFDAGRARIIGVAVKLVRNLL